MRVRREVAVRAGSDHGVARGNGNGEHPQRDHGREVERADAGGDTQRLPDAVGVDARAHVLRHLPHPRACQIALATSSKCQIVLATSSNCQIVLATSSNVY
jgi:hypothetical protein